MNKPKVPHPQEPAEMSPDQDCTPVGGELQCDIELTPVNDRAQLRMYALAVIVVIAPVLGVALWLNPDTRGYDTHTGLGLPACGFPQRWGLPCPACGMTTAFANLVRGRISAALRAQIFGTMLCFCCIGWTLLAIVQLASGRNLLGPVAPKMSWLLPAVAMLVAAWAIKAIQMTSGN